MATSAQTTTFLPPIEPVGVVRSSLREVSEAPRQAYHGAPEALVEIKPRFIRALSGLELGMDLVLLTWLDRADRHTLEVHPMDDLTLPLTGVFVTRSSSRPNPIGIHRVTVIGFEEPLVFRVSALEAIDGTPVIDVKVAFDQRNAA